MYININFIFHKSFFSLRLKKFFLCFEFYLFYKENNFKILLIMKI